MTANDKYPIRDCENLPSQIQMELPLKPKTFSDSFLIFLKATLKFKHLEKKYYRHRYFVWAITGYQKLG